MKNFDKLSIKKIPQKKYQKALYCLYNRPFQLSPDRIMNKLNHRMYQEQI